MTGCSDSKGEDAAAAGSSGPAGGPPETAVGFVEVQPVKVLSSDELPGRVVAYKEAEIRPQVSGIVQARMFDEGSYVKEGQQLYQIAPERFQADLQMAEARLKDAQARLENARLQADRFERLVRSNAITQQQYDDAQAQLNQSLAAVSLAEAEIAGAQINLDYTEVRAPIDGYIGPSSVTRGALVTALQARALATIRLLDPVYVDLSQTAAEARLIQERLIASRLKGEPDPTFEVTLYLGNSGETYPVTGTLDATDLAVDPRTGSIRLRSVFPNPDRILLPGLFVRASISETDREPELVVPQKSVVIGPDGSKSVWLVSPEETAIRRPIQTGGTYKNDWIVLEGLEPGDQVIVEGRMNLSEGAPLAPSRLDRDASSDLETASTSAPGN